MSEAQLRDCIIRATGLEPTQAADDILRTNPKQNTFVISTPSVTRAEAYVKIRELSVHGSTYEAMAYAAPPDNTSRGVIRNIPDYDTPDDITKSLVYRKNPTILQARRMGKSSSVIILFEGNKVPYYVYYRGAEMRCYLHKKTHEICEACGKVGHRTDVCPKPESTYCKVCGMQQPPENHTCEPKCALCGKGHPTGDKKCHQRFQTPYLLRQRQWQKKLREDETERRRSSSKERPSQTKERERERSPSTTRKNRSISFPRLPGSGNHKSRAKSREDSRPSRQGSRFRKEQSQATTPNVARDARRPPWGAQADDYCSDSMVSQNGNVGQIGIPAPNAQQNEQSELARIRQLLELLMQENRELKMQLATLKRGKETAPAAPEIKSANEQASQHIEEPTTMNESPAQENNHILDEDSNPPRKRAKEECEPATLDEKFQRKLEDFGDAIRTELKAAVSEAIGAMQEIVNRAQTGMSDRLSNIETTVRQMSSRMSQMDATLMDKKSKHCKPYDRHSSKDTLRGADYSCHGDTDN